MSIFLILVISLISIAANFGIYAAIGKFSRNLYLVFVGAAAYTAMSFLSLNLLFQNFQSPLRQQAILFCVVLFISYLICAQFHRHFKDKQNPA